MPVAAQLIAPVSTSLAVDWRNQLRRYTVPPDSMSAARKRGSHNCLNPVKEISIIKTVRSSSVDFNKLTAKSKRRKTSL